MEKDWEMIEECIEEEGNGKRKVMKLVILDEEEYEYERKVYERNKKLKVYVKKGNNKKKKKEEEDEEIDIEGIMRRMEWMVEKVIEEGWLEENVMKKMKVMIWGKRRGV